MDFTDTDFENAALVVQFDLNLVEGARDVYRRRTGVFFVGVGGVIHASQAGTVSLPIREQESSMSGSLTTRFLFLRYDPGLANRAEDMLPPSELLGTMQSEPSGDMYGVISPSVPTFPPSFPFYQRVAPTFGPQRPALGGLIGAGPQAETYWRLGSRQVQKADASGIAVWTTSLLTDAGKDEASYARVRTPHLFLAGSFSASGQRHVYLDRYGQATDSLSVALEPAGVAPGTKTEVRVTLKDSQGDPVADKDVTFAAEPVANSGGHDHGGSRPVGTFSGSNISFSSSPHGRTGPDGKLTATYTASAFGGQETIKVHVTDTPSVSTSAVLAVRERDPAGRVFVPLPTSPAIYVKDGGTLFHHGPGCTQAAGCDTPDQNHFGRLEVVQAMVAIATEWQETNPKLEINDISLSHGGAFDICGTWNVADTCTNAPPPNGGHKAHRLGRGVDFQVAPGLSPSTLPFRQRDQLRALLMEKGKGNVRLLSYKGIRSHWHVDFNAF
ncbi:MAG: hypothetical protein Q8T11_01650 [Elusimicrobiota bacterium]|nr:hypothetical protein [Elusimicrobiota bacterium]